MDARETAMAAIAEGMHILEVFAEVAHNEQWVTSSVPRGELDRFARELGFKDAEQ